MHKTDLRRLIQLMLTATVVLCVGGAQAKRDGQNMPCKVCHEGMNPPKLSVTFEPATATPGQSVRINVTASHPSALVGGVFVDTFGKGELKVIEGTQTRLIAPGQGTHSEPHPYAAGQVKFSFDWVAPSDVGASRFVVWSNAGNDNKMPADDSPTSITTYLAHGCTGVWSYPDTDLDGFGDQANGELGCAAVPGLLSKGGDCDDAKPTVHAGVTEVCNGFDDNCDGTVDEGFNPLRHYVDADGDGFGALGSMAIMGCSPIPGYAPKTGDCNDKAAEINPFATEMPNGIDDNCDSQIDEKPSPIGGTGGGSSGGGATTGGSAPTTPAEPNAGGCSFGGRSVGHVGWLLMMFGAAELGRRRRRSLLLQ